jgi:hypothetical protein
MWGNLQLSEKVGIPCTGQYQLNSGGATMNRRIIQILSISLFAVLLTAGAALSDEKKGFFEGQHYYEGVYDNDYTNDWFYDSYVVEDSEIGENEYRGYFGEKDSEWFTDDEYYSGYYDDKDLANDWWFDTYDDPGEEGFWDI